jgi:hypothetical protein
VPNVAVERDDFAPHESKSVPQRLKPSSAQTITARLNPCPSFDSLFPSLSGAVQIGQPKNLIWTDVIVQSPPFDKLRAGSSGLVLIPTLLIGLFSAPADQLPVKMGFASRPRSIQIARCVRWPLASNRRSHGGRLADTGRVFVTNSGRAAHFRNVRLHNAYAQNDRSREPRDQRS